MSIPTKNNVLVMQSGGCTPVLNRSLYGVVREASESGGFGEIYGATHGLEGVLSNELIPLRGLSKTTWSRVARTPAAALGSSRRRLKPEDSPTVLQRFAGNDIQYCFIIGGNDSAETGHSLALEARAAGYDLAIINVPKTIDNDLALTDHSPGYGSAARFVAMATMGAGRDAEAMGREAPITIIEVMGRDAGWLAASSVLGKREERDAPHMICVPEELVDEDEFVGVVEDAYLRFGFAVAVVSENVRGADGPLGSESEPWYVDDFGHPHYDSPARHLAGLISRRLKVRARHEKPGTIQRSLASCVSRVDAQEAEVVGRAAVRYALDGHTDRMVTLAREPGDRYRCNTGLAPLDKVAGQVKLMPSEYLDSANRFVTDEFIRYAMPLIGAPLPRFGRLV